MDCKKVYMLLELERIRELDLPHLYVFPTDLLEFSCAVFKGPVCIRFRLSKSSVEDKWSLTMGDLVRCLEFDEKEMDNLRSCDAHRMLARLVEVVGKHADIEVAGKNGETFPFDFEDNSNRERNIAAVLSFISNKCTRNT